MGKEYCGRIGCNFYIELTGSNAYTYTKEMGNHRRLYCFGKNPPRGRKGKSKALVAVDQDGNCEGDGVESPEFLRSEESDSSQPSAEQDEAETQDLEELDEDDVHAFVDHEIAETMEEEELFKNRGLIQDEADEANAVADALHDTQKIWDKMNEVGGLPTGLRDSCDMLTKYIAWIMGSPISRRQADASRAQRPKRAPVKLDTAYDIISYRAMQESFARKQGLSVRKLLALRRMNSRLLAIVIRLTLERTGACVRAAFQSMIELCERISLKQEQINTVSEVVIKQLFENLSTLQGIAGRALFNPRGKSRWDKPLGNLLGVPSVRVRRAIVTYAKGRQYKRKVLEHGVTQSIHYREPMEIIIRQAFMILKQHGPEAFAIHEYKDKESDVLVCAQDRNLAINAARRINKEVFEKYGEEGPRALVLLVHVYADEAHMTKNGRHALTPLKIRVMHRHMMTKNSFRNSCVVTYLNPVDEAAFIRQTENSTGSMSAKTLKKEFESSFWHGVMSSVFKAFLSANRNGLIVKWKSSDFILYPVLYSLSVDMPMVSKLSFTKLPVLGDSHAERMACQQCEISAPPAEGADKRAHENSEAVVKSSEADALERSNVTHNFWIMGDKAIVYRKEKDVLEYVKHEGLVTGRTNRQQQSLHFLGAPVAEGWNRFDEKDADLESYLSSYALKIELQNRGRFQLCGVDPLHGFLGFWCRNVTTAAVKGLLTISSTRQSVFKTLRTVAKIRKTARGTSRQFNEQSFVPTLDFDDDIASDSSSESEKTSDEDEVLSDDSAQTTRRKRARSGREVQPRSAVVKGKSKKDSSGLGQPETAKAVSQVKGSPADQLRAIIDSAAGNKWQEVAKHSLHERMYRRPAQYTRMRMSEFFPDLTKFAEHTYSLGLLLQMMVVVRHDKMLGVEARQSFLQLANAVVLMFTLMYQAEISTGQIQAAESKVHELQEHLHRYKNSIGLTWNAPKIHAIVHFPDSLRDFGPAKYWDTADGEKSFIEEKHDYERIALQSKGLGKANPFGAGFLILKKAEQNEYSFCTDFFVDAFRIKSSFSKERGTQSCDMVREEDEKQGRTWRRFNGMESASKAELFGKWNHVTTQFVFDGNGKIMREYEQASRPKSWNPSAHSQKGAHTEEADAGNELWASAHIALRAFVGEKAKEFLAATSGTVFVEAYKRVSLQNKGHLSKNEASVTQDTTVAQTDYYGRPQWDFVGYRIRNTNPRATGDEKYSFCYGQALLLLRLHLESFLQKAEVFDVAIVQESEEDATACAKQRSDCADCCLSKCHEMTPVFIHKTRKNAVVKVIDTRMLTERLTAFKDSLQEDSSCYFIGNPEHFEGVYIYN